MERTDESGQKEMHRDVEWLKPSDREILNEIRDAGGWIKPASLTLRLSYTLQHISTRCNVLAEHGLLERYSDDIAGYRVTEKGLKFLNYELDVNDLLKDEE